MSIERRQFLRHTMAAILSGLGLPLVSCTAGPASSGRFFAYSRNAAARPAAGTDEASAINSAFADLHHLNEVLQAGDTVVFPDDIYLLDEPIRLIDGVAYRGASGNGVRPTLDARGRHDYCLSGSGARYGSIEGLRCINARKNGIDIRANSENGRLPYQFRVRSCESSFNGRTSGANVRLRHAEGNGIAIHSGGNYLGRLEATTSGIVVEDCEAHGNQHAGILIDLPGVGHRISRCKAGGNGRAAGRTNSWGILIRPTGGSKPKVWTRSSHQVWESVAPNYRHQVPVRIVCSRLRNNRRGPWRNTAWDLARTRGDQRKPGPGEFGVVVSAPRYVPKLFLNPGPAQQFRPVICWIGDCREPLIEDCTAWNQGGSDGVGIGLDENTIGGLVRNCISHDNRRGFSLHINRGGAISQCVAYRNREYGIKMDRTIGTMTLTGNSGYENGLSDFYFSVMKENARLNLIGNRAHSDTGFLADSFDAAAAGEYEDNIYCGSKRGSAGLPNFSFERRAEDCSR